MEIEKHLAELAQADPQARRTALENVLTAEGLTPEIQECEADERRKAARNYLLYTADKDAKGPLFCAHYDAHPGSTGANDNAAAVCIQRVTAAQDTGHDRLFRWRGIRPQRCQTV